jgi:hypothetical protein
MNYLSFIEMKRETWRGGGDMNKILTQLIGLELRAALGAPVMLHELRRDLPGMNKVRFDKEVLDLAKSGEYFLIRHEHPGSLTVQDSAWMIPDGEGGFYYAINPRLESKPASPRRRGRPPVPAHLKRVHLKSACSVPQWIAEWLKKEGDTCSRIESALIEKYNLAPPENVIR